MPHGRVDDRHCIPNSAASRRRKESPRSQLSLLLLARSIESAQMAKAKTHFEQVPLATIKKTAEERDDKKQDAERVIGTESATKKTDPYSVPVGAGWKAKG